MYKVLLLIFLSIITSSCMKNDTQQTKEESLNIWVENQENNGWGFWIPKTEKSPR